jgi:hypothetical protein
VTHPPIRHSPFPEDATSRPSCAGSNLQELLSRALGVKPTGPQAIALWAECRAVLASRDLHETVLMMESESGPDTIAREDVLEALAEALTGRPWPVSDAPPEQKQAFFEVFQQALESRGMTLRG